MIRDGPGLARHVSQLLAEPMAWNQAFGKARQESHVEGVKCQAPVTVTALPNGVRVGVLGERLYLNHFLFAHKSGGSDKGDLRRGILNILLEAFWWPSLCLVSLVACT